MRLPDSNGRANRHECRVNDVADGQRGLITHAQLLALGVDPSWIQRRRRTGYLRTVYRGVYVVGHLALPPLARELAAVLACAPDAALSHSSAAAVWGIRPMPADLVEVTVIGRNSGQRGGVLVHRAAGIPSVDLTEREGMSITSVARTFVDIAPVLSPRQLELAFDEAQVRKLINPARLRVALERYPRCRGASALKELTGERPRTLTRVSSEELMLALIRRARLPPPECNAYVGRWSVDFLWRAQRVAVELDSYGFHTTRSAFERDREKDHVLRAHGIDLLRFTWHQLNGQPEVTLVRLVTALARASAAA